MKTTLIRLLAIAVSCAGMARGQATGSYTNFIRQIQTATGVQWDASVVTSGEIMSALPIEVGGGEFQLWTVLDAPLTSYLLDSRTVGAFLPAAYVTIRSEDPYQDIPRTRADRPFAVDITVSGILSGAGAPAESKALKVLRHVQSYGEQGTGELVDRRQATLHAQALLNVNGTQTLTYVLNSVPGEDRSKIRGEERFSVFSLAGEGVSEAPIASRFIQIWPVADAAISGISQDQVIRFKGPDLSIVLNDLYPSSRTYTQVYKGTAVSGASGTLVPDASVVVNNTVPVSSVLSIRDYDSLLDSDGIWTLEVLTETPFGIDRLAHVTFKVDRTMELHGTITTME